MVTSAQLALTQSPISSLIPSVGNIVTVKLDDPNYVTWNFQMELLLDGNGIRGFVDGSIPCPPKFTESDSEGEIVEDIPVVSDAYKIWTIDDKALMTLVTATLSTTALSCVIGCLIWTNLRARFPNLTRSSIVQLKIDLQNIKKGPKSIDDYLKRIKDDRDQLAAAGVVMCDEDVVIVALGGLPPEYNTIKAVIRGRESLVSLTELRSQLKAEESTLDETAKQVPLMSAMLAQSSGSVFDAGNSFGTKFCPSNQCSNFGCFAPGSSVQSFPPLQPMPFPSQVPPMFTPGPFAFVSQQGSGTYNNFRGHNFKGKGKGKKFFSGNQSQFSPHNSYDANPYAQFSQPGVLSSGSQGSSSQVFNPL